MKLSERLTADGPKRILALDGGGIRGALELGYLGEIEKILRARHQRTNLLLCDYFDFIGGTSTGAIIAAALAIGKEVDEIKQPNEARSNNTSHLLSTFRLRESSDIGSYRDLYQ